MTLFKTLQLLRTEFKKVLKSREDLQTSKAIDRNSLRPLGDSVTLSWPTLGLKEPVLDKLLYLLGEVPLLNIDLLVCSSEIEVTLSPTKT
jgi:hypothetical protein